MLRSSVKRRMAADVPVGMFLSGGYDSSLVCAIAQELAEQPVRTYCIGFEQKEINEAEHAKTIADYLGTKHTEKYISEEDMLRLVEEIPCYYDEPFADSSQIATMLLAELAKKDVTVALSGDGGDELFGGYNTYTRIQKAQKIDFLGALLYYLRKIPMAEKVFRRRPRSLALRIVSDSRDKAVRTQTGVNTYIEAINKLLLQEGISCYYPIELKYHVKEWDIRRMLLDMETYLPDDILCKVDRATMKYALECRCPILDKEIIEYSYRLPSDMKDDNGNQKKILKSIAYDYLPRELLDRPKAGFVVPVNIWLRNHLRERLEAYSDMEFLKRQEIFHAEHTRNLVMEYLRTGDKGKNSGANYSYILWPYFVFQQWYEYYFVKQHWE